MRTLGVNAPLGFVCLKERVSLSPNHKSRYYSHLPNEEIHTQLCLVLHL